MRIDAATLGTSERRTKAGYVAAGRNHDDCLLRNSGRMSWPVSRILFRTAAENHGGEAATIHLDTPSPGASSGLPANSGLSLDTSRVSLDW